MFMTYEWKNKAGEVAVQLSVDDTTGIGIRINNEEKLKHGKEIEEMQTLNMYPPKNEEQIKGMVSPDGLWTNYEIAPGKNWEFAKKDIVATFDFWMNGLNIYK